MKAREFLIFDTCSHIDELRAEVAPRRLRGLKCGEQQVVRVMIVVERRKHLMSVFPHVSDVLLVAFSCQELVIRRRPIQIVVIRLVDIREDVKRHMGLLFERFFSSDFFALLHWG
jgi:hypothetical protein